MTTTTAYIDTDFLRTQAPWASANDVSTLLTPADKPAPIPLVLQTSALPQLHAAFARLLNSQDRVDPTFHRLTHVTRFLAVLAHNNIPVTVEHNVVRRATASCRSILTLPGPSRRSLEQSQSHGPSSPDSFNNTYKRAPQNSSAPREHAAWPSS